MWIKYKFSFDFLNHISFISKKLFVAIGGHVSHGDKREGKDEADQLTVSRHENELIVVETGGNVNIETVPTGIGLSDGNVLDEIGVSGIFRCNKDGLTEGTHKSNQDIISLDVSFEVIQVPASESSHDDLNVGAHFIGNLCEVFLDGGRRAIDDFF